MVVGRLLGISPGLQGYSLFELLKLLGATKRSRELPIPLTKVELARETTLDLEKALACSPNEWVYLYALTDHFNRLKEYAKAVDTGERLVGLRPNDPRSTFTLGTVYRILGRSRYAEPQYAQDLLLAGVSPSFDPRASKRELDILGLTPAYVLERAIVLFEKTLSLKIKRAEKSYLASQIASMMDDLQQLGVNRITQSPEIGRLP